MDRITDYRLLYEAQRRENEDHRRKIFELEAKQRVLECTFRNIKQLRSELSYITKEAESRQDQIHGFLSAFIPEFKNYRNSELNSNSSRRSSISSSVSDENVKTQFGTNNRLPSQENNNILPNKLREKSLQETKKEVENNFARHNSDRLLPLPPANADIVCEARSEKDTKEEVTDNPFAKNLAINIKSDDGKSLPLPKVEYNWKEREAKVHKIPTYLPRLGYSMCSPSFTSSSLSGDSVESDELKLTLKYENESSKNLPTKIQLEICDEKTGRIVFRKRQNIYYVKLQENLASLNSAQDYVLTVTSISGREKAEEKVTIHNKYYTPEEDVKQPEECTIKDCEQQMINDIILPDLTTALQEFDEEVRFMEETNIIDSKTLGLPKDNIKVNPTQVVEDDTLCRATKSSNIVLRREKSPSPESKRSLSPERRTSITSIQSLPKSPMILMKKPVLPIISKYRWQNGFRKSKAGQYAKVALLKIELEFSSDFEFLPTSLQFSLHPDNSNNNNNNYVNGNSEPPLISKHVKISRNRFLCEMAANECNEEMVKILDKCFDGDFMVYVQESCASSKSASCIIPDFVLLVENQLVRSPVCDNNFNGGSHLQTDNSWIDTDPVLTVEHFKKSMMY